MPSVKVDLENLGDGARVEVPYLGKFQNKTTTEVDQRVWDRWKKLSPQGAGHEGSTLELTTAAQRAQADAVVELQGAKAAELGLPTEDPANPAQTGAESFKPLSERSKTELVKMANDAGGIENPDRMNKDDLVAALTGDANPEG